MVNAYHFLHMQAAVDIVADSEHPTNKVAATLSGKDLDGQGFLISRTNRWPESIKNAFGIDSRIGDASGSIHAETLALIESPLSQDAEIYVTDIPCPNCIKNMAESGIRALYIDHKGFDKDYAQRRGAYFETMSMPICQKAGIAVYKLYRKLEKLETLFEPKQGYSPALEKPVRLLPLPGGVSTAAFQGAMIDQGAYFKGRPFALALAESPLGRAHVIAAETHPVQGMTSHDLDDNDPKYSFMVQPLNRVMMTASRYGLRLVKDAVFSSRVPTARELVNLIGAGHHTLYLGDMTDSRNPEAMQAMTQLRDAGIIAFRKL